MGAELTDIRTTEICANLSRDVVVGGGILGFVANNLQIISISLMAVGIFSQLLFNVLTQLRLSRSEKRKESKHENP